MPFTPALPLTGLAGLRFLESTMDKQVELFEKSPDVQREIDYFLEKAPSIQTSGELVTDRRILSVVLGAFGLDEDINKQAFIRKVIDEGTLDTTSFANRLVDPAYREMSNFLGFGDFGNLLVVESNQNQIVEMYRERQFELAVGEIDLDMRLALNFKREVAEIAAETSDPDTGWLLMLGSPPLRQVVETALNLPTEFALIDLDQQVEEISSRAKRLLDIDAPTDFLNSEVLGKFVDRFMLQQQIASGSSGVVSTRGTAALSLLSASGLGSSAQTNLFSSNFI